MKRYKPIYEKRKNPYLNPHIGAWEYVEIYRNDPDVFITFTAIDKIGINPNSKYSTPTGIYCYPLKEFYTRYLANGSYDTERALGRYAPFAGSSPFVTFFKLKSSMKSRFINDMYSDYTNRNYSRDIKILEKKYKYTLEDEYEFNFKQGRSKTLWTWDDFIREAKDDAKVQNPIMFIWNITRILSKFLTTSERSAAAKWTLMLLKDLGYVGFADRDHRGYIHPGEPTQAVFFTIGAFDEIARVANIPKKGKESLEKEGQVLNLLSVMTPMAKQDRKAMLQRKLIIVFNDGNISYERDINVFPTTKKLTFPTPEKFLLYGRLTIKDTIINSLKNIPYDVEGLEIIRNKNLKHIDYFPKYISSPIIYIDKKYKDDKKSLQVMKKFLDKISWT